METGLRPRPQSRYLVGEFYYSTSEIATSVQARKLVIMVCVCVCVCVEQCKFTDMGP